MRIGVPTEIKTDEHRVALTPDGARELTDSGHIVLVQPGAGAGAGFSDDAYVIAGAEVVAAPEDIFASADMIVKVKEPLAQEVPMLRPHQLLLTYLHLAADSELTRGLMASGAVCLAYETVVDGSGGLPLLAPMSEIAGRLAAQEAATALKRSSGGRGLLLGGVGGVSPGFVMVIGAGAAGRSAAEVPVGLGGRVVLLDRDPACLRDAQRAFGAAAETRFSTAASIDALLPVADVVIGAVLIKGARTPRLVSREQLSKMRPGSVLVDISIDQGGCFETSRPTTHREPTFSVDDVVHYCVANMPGAVPVTSTWALTNATLPYIAAIARPGIRDAMPRLPGLGDGVNVAGGYVTCPPVADVMGMNPMPVMDALASEAI